MPHAGDKEHASKQHVVIAGSIAGLLSRFVIAPLDVVKIRLQLQPHPPHPPHPHHAPASPLHPIYRGILPTMRQIVRDEGIPGLWKGNIPAELLYLTYGAAQFLAYRQAHVAVSSLAPPGVVVPEPVKSFVAGAAAGGVATTVTYPFDLLRTRFAAQGGEKVYESLLHSIRHIAEHEGLRGYFRGLSSAVTQIVPYMGIFFGTYETLRTYLSALPPPPPPLPQTPPLPTPPPPPSTRQKSSSPSSPSSSSSSSSSSPRLSTGWSDAISGSVAGVVGKTAVFPLDLIRKRLQVQGPTRERYVHRNIPVYAGVYATGRDIVRQAGWRGLYRGLTVSLVKAAPLSALTMWCFEGSLRALEWVHPSVQDEA